MPIVSLFRMQGYHNFGKDVAPIIRLNGYKSVPGDYRKLPIGLSHTDDWEEIEKQLIGEKEANHCVVIVGCNDEEVCLNDPATFPFLTATFDELIDSRAFHANLNVEAAIAKRVKPEYQVDGVFDEEDLAPFQMIAVTNPGVRLPLLDNTVSSVTDVRELPGSKGIISFAYDIQTMPFNQFNIDLRFGRNELGVFHLAQKNKDDLHWQSDVDTSFEAFVDKLPNKWFWVQIHGPDQKGLSKGSFWFWNASLSKTRVKEALALVVVQDNEDNLYEIYSG